MNSYMVTIPNYPTVWVAANNVAGAKRSACQNFNISRCPKGTIVEKD